MFHNRQVLVNIKLKIKENELLVRKGDKYYIVSYTVWIFWRIFNCSWTQKWRF